MVLYFLPGLRLFGHRERSWGPGARHLPCARARPAARGRGVGAYLRTCRFSDETYTVFNTRFLGRPAIADFGGLGGPGGPQKPFQKVGGFAYLRLVTHFKFLIVGPEQKLVTKRP